MVQNTFLRVTPQAVHIPFILPTSHPLIPRTVNRLHSSLGLEESLASTLAELHSLLHELVGVVAEASGGERASDLLAGLRVEEDLAGDVSELGSRVPDGLDVGEHVGAAVGIDLGGQ